MPRPPFPTADIVTSWIWFLNWLLEHFHSIEEVLHIQSLHSYQMFYCFLSLSFELEQQMRTFMHEAFKLKD